MDESTKIDGVFIKLLLSVVFYKGEKSIKNKFFSISNKKIVFPNIISKSINFNFLE